MKILFLLKFVWLVAVLEMATLIEGIMKIKKRILITIGGFFSAVVISVVLGLLNGNIMSVGELWAGLASAVILITISVILIKKRKEDWFLEST